MPDTFAAELTMAALVSQAALTPLLAGWLIEMGGTASVVAGAQGMGGYRLMFLIQATFALAGYVVMARLVRVTTRDAGRGGERGRIRAPQSSLVSVSVRPSERQSEACRGDQRCEVSAARPRSPA